MSRSNSGECGKCGVCLAVCPVYKQLMEEQSSPRAKIQLIKAFQAGRLPSSTVLKELVNKCLMCGTCAANCPSGVDHYSQFMQMRADLVQEHGDRLELRSLVYLLAKEQRLKFVTNLAQKGQALVPEGLLSKCKVGNIPANRLPRLNKKPFRATETQVYEPEGEKLGTLVYFTGCATNYIFDRVGQATVGLLTRMGYQVVIPGSQTCCSIPMLYHGAIEQAQENIAQNLQCLDVEEAEAVVVDCPTCGAALKNEYPEMAEQYSQDERAAARISGKVRDIMSFIGEHLDLLDLPQGLDPVPVTYHAPCHLKNAFNPAEQMLSEIPALEYRPSGDALNCCGGGGTFFYEYPEISAKMSADKVENAKKTGANYWLTDCPVCHINLQGQLDEQAHIQVQHPVELLWRILRGELANGEKEA